MPNTIPQQLQNEAFRFVKIKPKTKDAFEKGWQNLNYSYKDVQTWKGANYGVISGHGDLLTIEADHREIMALVERCLPETFSVLSGGGNKHYYFFCKQCRDFPNKCIGLGKEDIHFGGIRAYGVYTIAPGSIHPDTNQQYMVDKDIPVATVSKDDVIMLLNGYIAVKDLVTEDIKKEHQSLGIKESILDILPVEAKGRLAKISVHELRGAHPVHGSTTGKNFCIDTLENAWYCFRCNSGGGFLQWLAVQESVIQCNEAGLGVLKGDLFKKVVKIAEEKYHITINTKPVIYVTSGDMEKQTSAAWEAIKKANADKPFMFIFGGVPIRIELDAANQPLVRLITEQRMRHHLERIIDWRREVVEDDGISSVSVFPPMAIIRDILATAQMPLPILEGIVETPIFAEDGSLNMQPGYDSKTRVYYFPSKNFILKPLPEKPSEEDVKAAKDLIYEAVQDFPYTGKAEYAHTVSLILLPFARKFIKSPTPLHLIDKPTVGTGATLLAQVISHICTGHDFNELAEGRDSDEWRKRITAALRNSPQFIVIDNIREQLNSAHLSCALTLTIWEDRILGFSENIRIPIRCAWVATGNNPVLSSEIARRTIRIRLDAKTDRPWLRNPKTFKHPELLKWVDERRSDLVYATCVLIKKWLIDNRPNGDLMLGMFESWSSVLGGILKACKIEGFLDNLNEFYEASDIDGVVLNSFISAWYDTYQANTITASELFSIATSKETPLNLGKGNEQSQRITLGKILTKLKDRCFTITNSENDSKETFIVKVARKGTRNRAQLWSLEFQDNISKNESINLDMS